MQLQWIMALIGGVLLAAIARDNFPSFLMGAALGWLAGRVLELNQRLDKMESEARERARLEAVARRNELVDAPAPQARPEPAPADKPRAWAPEARRLEPEPVAAEPAAASEMAVPEFVQDRGSEEKESPQPRQDEITAHVDAPWLRKREPQPDWRDHAIVRWLLQGNVPVKVGVLVSFFGVAFLLKYAVEAGWMILPVEFRLLLIAGFGAAMIWFGLRIKETHRVYALSIQGGGIGVLYLTTYAALRLYNVLPAEAAFFVLAALAAGAGWLAVKQDARQLAVLGSIGGFIAPILASTGSGSHVALFGYYLVLNIGIAGVALYKHWRMLNLIGFGFTFGVGLIWGARFYQPQYFASVEPFLVAHFLLYTAVAILSAVNQPFRLKGFVDSALVFGLPLVAFPLQVGLVNGETYPLAWSATVVAVFYALISRFVVARWGEQLRLLSQVYLSSAVVFGTLAVPLWLDGPWISNTWALEAVAMIAIGLKQRTPLTHWGGVALIVLSAGAYFVNLGGMDGSSAILNERFLGGCVLVIALTLSTRIYAEHPKELGGLPLVWLAAVTSWIGWLVLGTAEIMVHASDETRAAMGLGYAAVLTITLERAAVRWAPQARMLAASLLLLMVVYASVWVTEDKHFLPNYGWLAWPLAFGALATIIHRVHELRPLLLTAGVWFVIAWAVLEITWIVGLRASPELSWDTAIALATALSLALLARRQLPRLYPDDFDVKITVAPIVALAFLGSIGWVISEPGNFRPFPYLPIANLMFFTTAAIACFTHRFAEDYFERDDLLKVAVPVALLLVTMEVARVTHFAGNVRFDLAPMWRSDLFQTALSIVWSVIGIAAMVYGTKLAERRLWVAGAALMGTVVLKLFLVDLGNSGSLTRVVSFIGVGLLLLAVGYFAPAPATKPADATTGGDAASLE